jgi:ADP-heptose:LPS heptosyltransferase
MTGLAREHHERTGRRVLFTHPRRTVYWSEVFHNNPHIVRQACADCDPILQGGGIRPYILGKTPTRWTWKPYKPIPGDFFFTEEEFEFGRKHQGLVMIEPNVKNIGHPNKDWSRGNWERLATLLAKQVPLAQFVGPHSTPLPGVKVVVTTTFRKAASVLRYALGAVLPEGGLHHAAAAVGRPSVVIYGGFISPLVTGYKLHANIYRPDESYPLGCGSRVKCAHCAKAMSRIAPESVAEELLQQLARGGVGGQALQRGDLPGSDSRASP